MSCLVTRLTMRLGRTDVRASLCFVAASTGDSDAANAAFNVNHGAAHFSLEKFDVGIKDRGETGSPRCVVLVHHAIINLGGGRQGCQNVHG